MGWEGGFEWGVDVESEGGIFGWDVWGLLWDGDGRKGGWEKGCAKWVYFVMLLIDVFECECVSILFVFLVRKYINII